MGDITPPSGCMQSLEKCIDALCAEKSKGTGIINWLQRMSEWSTLGQLDENLSGSSSQACYYEPESRVMGSTQYGHTRWASNESFSETWARKDFSANQKGFLRQRIARHYLNDHPDDCQPPRPVAQPVPQQLSLFDDLFHPAKDTHFQPVEVEPRRAWWTAGTFVALGAVITMTDRVATFAADMGSVVARGALAAEAIPFSLATIGVRHYMDDLDRRRPDML